MTAEVAYSHEYTVATGTRGGEVNVCEACPVRGSKGSVNAAGRAHGLLSACAADSVTVLGSEFCKMM